MNDLVSGLAASSITQTGTAHGGDLQGLANRFNAMMQREPDPSIYTEQHLQQSGSPVSEFVRAQEGVMRQTFDDVQAFTVQAAHMDMQQLAARQIELQYQVAMVSVQFNSGVYVAQSGKTGLQTLMKNQ